jgi:hypothetical protein
MFILTIKMTNYVTHNMYTNSQVLEIKEDDFKYIEFKDRIKSLLT